MSSSTQEKLLVVYLIFVALICFVSNGWNFVCFMVLGTHFHQHSGVSMLWTISSIMSFIALISSLIFVALVLFDKGHYCYFEGILWFYLGLYPQIFMSISFYWSKIIPVKDKLNWIVRIVIMVLFAVCYVFYVYCF